MAVAIVEWFKQESMYGLSAETKKVVVVGEVKGFATSLVFKVRVFGTRPMWPIFYLLIGTFTRPGYHRNEVTQDDAHSTAFNACAKLVRVPKIASAFLWLSDKFCCLSGLPFSIHL